MDSSTQWLGWCSSTVPEVAHFRIDNVIPLGARANWLTGAGATRAELALVYGTSLAGTAIIWLLFMRTQPWAVWQVVIALAITADLIGGAVANALSSTKRQYQTPVTPGAKPWVRIVRNPVAFTVLHVYPLVVIALYPGGSWAWGIGWYAATIAAVMLVAWVVPGYLQRPTAMAIFVLAIPVAMAAPGPAGWSWLPPILMAKLLLAHAVHEEPYRP